LRTSGKDGECPQKGFLGAGGVVVKDAGLTTKNGQGKYGGKKKTE